MNIRKFFRQSKLVQRLYYALHIDDLAIILFPNTFDKQINNAFDKYLPLDERKDVDLKIMRKDIKHCYFKYKASVTEYFLFSFKDLNDEQRNSFITDKLIYKTMAQLEGRRIHDKELEDKFAFSQITNPFFKREVALVSTEQNRAKFVEMACRLKRLIVKPNSSACGTGIYVIHIENEEQANKAFDKMLADRGEWMIEEFIDQDPEMAVWNQSSVNTVRISSFLNQGHFNILCPFIRTGRSGSVVDNGGQGGLYAAIDLKTGKIMTDGKDELNHIYKTHPDSNIPFKDWQVPQWEKLVALTEKVHRSMPNHLYVGWDFALSKDGWVLIEGNWGEFIAQQSTTNHGYKKEFFEYLNCRK